MGSWSNTIEIHRGMEVRSEQNDSLELADTANFYDLSPVRSRADGPDE